MAQDGYRVYTEGASGEKDGATSAEQMPDVPCQMVYIKAINSNAGNVYIGFVGVTVVDGTTDTTSGYELAAGQALGPIPIDNLNRLYIICNNTGDDVSYLALRA